MRRVPRLSEIPERLPAAEFWQLIGLVEHEQLDFKRKPNPDLASPIAAMAMTDGGLVVLGVSNERSLLGCPLDQETLDMVKRAAHSACDVEVQLKEVVVGNARVSVVAIPEVRGRIVTTPDGRLLRRVGSDNQPLVGDALGRFVREREGRSAEDESVPVADLDDFELELVNKALARDHRPKVRRDSLLRALLDLGVAKPASAPADTTITTAAIVLFAKDPKRYIKGASVQVVRRAGVGPGPGPTTPSDRTTRVRARLR